MAFELNDHVVTVIDSIFYFSRLHPQVHPLLLEGVTRKPPGLDGLLVYREWKTDLWCPDWRHWRRDDWAWIRRRVLQISAQTRPLRVQHGARESVHRHYKGRKQRDHFPEFAFLIQVCMFSFYFQ